MAKDRDREICEHGCIEPKGTIMVEVPPPTKAYDDVLGCPNPGCYKVFLVQKPTKRIVVEGR
jgi:hypothetical protein